MNRQRMWLMAGAVILLASLQVAAEPPDYARKDEAAQALTFLHRLKRDVPVLTHPRGDRWPMICWEAIGFEPQDPELYKALLDRGLTQHIRLDAKMIPTAKALQEAGAPVIMMQGMSGPWPYSSAGNWEHQYEEGYEPKKSKRWWPSWKACPAVFEGWQINADRIRETLRKFKDAGVTVDAVWMDWEGEPSSSRAQEGWENARHCLRCQKTLPPKVLADSEMWEPYCRRLNEELIGAYLAAPVREVFPGSSVTNWVAVYSTPDRLVRGWSNSTTPPMIPSMLTASNPVAYGNTYFWKFWDKDWPIDRRHVDRFYMHLLLRHISNDTANRLIYAPEKDSFPWVARWCPDNPDPDIPIVSREAYREALRHIWLRGADGMQIFNARRKGYDELVFTEVIDAVAVYDEMLAYADLLDRGKPMCLDVPDVQFDGVLWSGRRLPDKAVVRLICQDRRDRTITLEPWPGEKARLKAPIEGATYLLHFDGDDITVAEP